MAFFFASVFLTDFLSLTVGGSKVLFSPGRIIHSMIVSDLANVLAEFG